MKLYDIIAGAQSGPAIQNLARAAEVQPEQLDVAIQAVLPEFSRAIERNTLSRGGLADLVAALGDGHHEVILDNPAALADPRVVDDGNQILGHMLGSRDRSRAVASQAAQAAGLSDSLIRMLMPIIAQMVMGAIAKWAKGGLGDVIQKIPGGMGQGGGQGGDKGGLPFPMPEEQERGPAPGSGHRRGGGGFELPRSDVPEGGYPMPPMPGGQPGGGASSQQRGGAGQSPQDGDSGGGFQIPWPRPPSGGPPRSGGQSPFPFPFPSPFPQQQDDSPGSDPAPPPRQSQRRPSGGAKGGFGLPETERPTGGFPMPPMPGGSGGGNAGRLPVPQGGGSGLPMPGPTGGQGNNPYGDLSDILRRGAEIGGAPSGGIVRKALGGLLGFGGGGMISWFVRLIVLRWGWGLLKRFFGRR